MRTLLLISTIILAMIMILKIIVKWSKRRPVWKMCRALIFTICTYALMWLFFFITRKDIAIAFGTDICFDDWCATVQGVDFRAILGRGVNEARAEGIFVILAIRVSNHARGIAQKPSEPRIHVIDNLNHSWSFSNRGQQALTLMEGPQIEIGSRLALHASAYTKLVFEIRNDAKGLVALIEEGPIITRLLLPEDRYVFVLR